VSAQFQLCQQSRCRLAPGARDPTQMNRTHSLVAQIFNLPYQRRNESSRAPQSATLRNSRLKICATIYRPAQAISECAFTFVELLVVLAVVAALAATLLPVMAKSRPNSLAFQCLNNNRQLCAAWSMYAGDNRDRIVYSAYDTSSSTPAGQATWSLDFMDF